MATSEGWPTDTLNGAFNFFRDQLKVVDCSAMDRQVLSGFSGPQRALCKREVLKKNETAHLS